MHRLRLITVLRPPKDSARVSHRDGYAGDAPLLVVICRCYCHAFFPLSLSFFTHTRTHTHARRHDARARVLVYTHTHTHTLQLLGDTLKMLCQWLQRKKQFFTCHAVFTRDIVQYVSVNEALNNRSACSCTYLAWRAGEATDKVGHFFWWERETDRGREIQDSNGLIDLSECSYQHTQHGTQK